MLVACVRRAAAELSASSTLTRALHVSPMAAAKAKGPKKGAEEKEVRDAIPHPGWCCRALLGSECRECIGLATAVCGGVCSVREPAGWPKP